MKQTSGSDAIFFSKPLVSIVARRRVDMIPTFNSPPAPPSKNNLPQFPRGDASARRFREEYKNAPEKLSTENSIKSIWPID